MLIKALQEYMMRTLYFYPESILISGRSSDLLPFYRLPIRYLKQWPNGKKLMELTAAGTVPNSHRIPF